jgi:hypothetical protein
MSWENLENPRGEAKAMTRGLSEVATENMSRGSIDEPLHSERELEMENERVSQAVERSENIGEEPESFSRDAGVVRVVTDSRVADVFEAPMRKGLYGVTRMDTFPFKIVINSRMVKPRQQVSLIHEMLHVWAKLHKMEDLPHDKLHDLAVFIRTEIVPVLEKYMHRNS